MVAEAATARVSTAPAAAITTTTDGVSDWRLSRSFVAKPIVGPGTYKPGRALTARRAPSYGFGTSSRFGAKNEFYTHGHTCELRCKGSPGPKYRPDGYPHRHKAPVWKCGPDTPTTKEKREEKAQLEREAKEAELGPASYKPRVVLTKPAVPQTAFSKSPRFHHTQPYVNESAALRSHHIHTYKPSPDRYHPKDKIASPRAEVHGMGPAAYKPNGKKKPYPPFGRSGFLTEDLRHGLAMPATYVANVAGSNYTPKDDTSTHTAPKFGFGSAERLRAVDPQFHSKTHVIMTNMGQQSPGPKYKVASPVETTMTPRGGALQWVP